MEEVCAHLYISGGVQGVFYRATAYEEAKQRNLVGWVRNLRDGRVELLLQGTKDKVEDMIRWCWRGPPSARVTDVRVGWETLQQNLKDFGIVY